MIRIALLVVLVGCKTRNPLSCEIPENQGTADCPLDGQQPCTDTAQCATGVCDTNAGVCVECLVEGDCDGKVCNTTEHACESCDAHADCGSHACDFSSGNCLDETTIAYVAAGGTNAMCTKAAPCGSITQALATSRPNIKFEGTAKVTVTATQTIATPVRILADRGAALASTATGAVVKVDNTVVAIEDLEIREGVSSTGDAIFMQGADAKLTLDRVMLAENKGKGVNSTQGELTMRRSTVALNDQGGISVVGQFTITNCIIVINGSSASMVGGVRVASERPTSIFTFNTVAANLSDAGDLPQRGMSCNLGGFTNANNIVDGNEALAVCDFTFSLFNNAAIPTGNMNNQSGDPKFDAINNGDLHKPTFFRIKSGSKAIDAADPAATETVDIDGQPRPATGKDMGADEFVP